MGGPNKGQNFDSGAEFRVRGNTHQVLERYLQLARDAGVAGDRVAAESYLQHADHYYRVLTAIQDGQRPRVGGREISIADVNVQNVSQGLSAALSTSSAQLNQNPGAIGIDGNQQNGAAPMEPGNGPARESGQEFNRAPAATMPRGPVDGDQQPAQPAFARAARTPEPIPMPIPVALPVAMPSPSPAIVPPPDEQPDYPEELLPQASPVAAVPIKAASVAEDANRPMRSRLRGRPRAPARRPCEPGEDGPESEGVDP